MRVIQRILMVLLVTVAAGMVLASIALPAMTGDGTWTLLFPGGVAALIAAAALLVSQG